jgi:hypothetical protein
MTGRRRETPDEIGRLNMYDGGLCRYLLQVVGVVVSEIRYQASSLTAADYSFLCQEMAHLLLYITHMLQSGEYTSCLAQLSGNVEKLKFCGSASHFTIGENDSSLEGLPSVKFSKHLSFVKHLSCVKIWWSCRLR